METQHPLIETAHILKTWTEVLFTEPALTITALATLGLLFNWNFEAGLVITGTSLVFASVIWYLASLNHQSRELTTSVTDDPTDASSSRLLY